MNDCGLTRGGFYAHVSCKAELYQEALTFAALSTKIANLKPQNLSDKQWLRLLLDEYLSLEHVKGKHPCPLAFLATDINVKNDGVNTTYASTFRQMNAAIMAYAKSYADCDE